MPCPAQVSVLAACSAQSYPWLCVPVLPSAPCLNAFIWIASILPRRPRALEQLAGHHPQRLSGCFNPDIFLPVCKLPVQHEKSGTA